MGFTNFTSTNDSTNDGPSAFRAMVGAGLLLGAGLGGAVDGALLAQVMHLHLQLSPGVGGAAGSGAEGTIGAGAGALPPGASLLVGGVLAVAGVARLRHAGLGDGDQRAAPLARWSARTFGGAVLLGWGGFHLAAVALCHGVLGLHHPVERAPGGWCYEPGLLLLGMALALLGAASVHRGRRDAIPMGE